MAFPPGFLWIPNVHHSVTWPRGWPTRPRRASAPGAAAFLSSWAENGHWFREFSHEAWWIFPVRYVKLPEGTVKGEHPWSNRWINMFEIYIYINIMMMMNEWDESNTFVPVWPETGRLKIQGNFNGFEVDWSLFRTEVFPYWVGGATGVNEWKSKITLLCTGRFSVANC
jgi:hypothetical protein